MSHFSRVAIAFVALVFASFIVWFLLSVARNQSTEAPPSEFVVPSIPEIVPVINPVEVEIPEASPTQNTNPFSNTYTNPFK